VELWFRRRGSETWSRLRAGRFDAAGRWTASYAGVDDHEYWASSGTTGSADTATLAMPVVTGPSSAALGSTVQLAGRARPGDSVVVESRRRGAGSFTTRTTLTADRLGTFSTSYAADDEYEYRPLAATRVGAVRRTTVAPTVAGAAAVRRGALVTLTGTARPGAAVEVLFRREGPSTTVGGRRDRDLPTFRVGRTVTAGLDGRWTTSFAPTTPHAWYARSDGNASPVRRTAVR
jgi:hypothetical protein